MDPSKQTYLVIGATSDIGRAICGNLASKNANLILHGRDQKKIDQLNEQFHSSVATVSHYLADLEDEASINNLCQNIKQDLGRIVLDKVITKLADVSKVDREVHMEGRQMVVVLSKGKLEGKDNDEESKKTETQNQELGKQTL